MPLEKYILQNMHGTSVRFSPINLVELSLIPYSDSSFVRNHELDPLGIHILFATADIWGPK